MSAAAVLSPWQARVQRQCAEMRAGLYARRPAPSADVYELTPTEAGGIKWDRGAVCALAYPHCHSCHGSGLRAAWRGGPPRSVPCKCVFQWIFRAVMRRYRAAVEFRPMSRVSIDYIGRGRQWGPCAGRKSEEFLADVWLVARRYLDRQHWCVFRLHCVERHDWRACTARLGIDRGNFFHAVYRIEQRLGRVFRELRPYALFPVDEYFNGAGERPLDVITQINRRVA